LPRALRVKSFAERERRVVKLGFPGIDTPWPLKTFAINIWPRRSNRPPDPRRRDCYDQATLPSEVAVHFACGDGGGLLIFLRAKSRGRNE
jgi:hypothetical protein